LTRHRSVCDVRIKRLLDSIERGIDHELVATRVRELQAGRSRLEATLGADNQWRRLSVREIAEWADSLLGVVQVLKQANPEDRAALYAEFCRPPVRRDHPAKSFASSMGPPFRQ
jgi:hypothetical protein